jgi:exopolysaccharide biosynthesis polyprenyl glycosylphosphotransferase
MFLFSGLYKPFKGLSQINEFTLITKGISTITLFAIVIHSFLRMPYSRSIVVLTGVFAIAFISLFRWAARTLAERWEDEGGNEEDKTRILVVGTGEVARLICHKLHHTKGLDTLILGMVDAGPPGATGQVDTYPILGSLDQLGNLIDTYKAQEVFVALPTLPQRDVMDLVDKHSSREGVHFYVVSNLFDLISVEIDLAEHHNIPLAFLRNEPMALLHQLIKRIFDIAVALAVFLTTFPFWFLIMAAIRLETDGSSFFTQDRVGKDGKLFRIFKFRTMHASTGKYDYSPSAPGDSRITRVGRFLRKTSLDEFPQFINVLRGEMSLVGPRPEMPFIVNQYKSWERQRLKVKPGITGLWQIMGRKDLPLHESLEYDFYYIKNQTLLLDLTILLRTIPVILKGKGAY